MHHSEIDRYCRAGGIVHRIDARAKLPALIAYLAVLVSFDRYAVAAMAPLTIGPVVVLAIAGVPVRFVLRRIVVLCPFIAMFCVLSPLYDRGMHDIAFGPWRFAIAGGWLTAANIAVKFSLSVVALTAVMCTTPFVLLLEAMRKLHLPQALVMQLSLLYRYIFVLTDEAMRLRRGRDFRGASLAPARRRLAAVGGIIGSLLVRTIERSHRIHTAMCARGFRGRAQCLETLRFRPADAAFLVLTAVYLAACRWAYPLVFS